MEDDVLYRVPLQTGHFPLVYIQDLHAMRDLDEPVLFCWPWPLIIVPECPWEMEPSYVGCCFGIVHLPLATLYSNQLVPKLLDNVETFRML